MGNNASYDIKPENQIGKGSFAVVYKVKRPGTLELCAAKVYNVPISMMLAREKQGYERELKILKNVNHPFVIRYIEEFEHQRDFLCIVTQFAQGGDLDTIMRKREGKPFTEEVAMNYFTMILIGLHELHSKNIYHRDLKPANVLIDFLQDGTQILKIGDFGISKAADLQSTIATMKLTQTTIVGTIAYMAPEVLNKKSPDSKVDIWALGVMLYEFLTCKHPFSFAIGDITNKDEPFVPLPQSVSPFMQGLVTQLLQKDPTKRPNASSLLMIQEIKTQAEKLVKQIGDADPDYGQQLNEQLSIFIPKVQIKTDFLFQSKCVVTDEERAFLQKVMEERKMGTSLLFRGSRDGWMWEDFHQRCDLKGPSVTLMRVKDGPCIGGFTLCQWSSDEIGFWKTDVSAILFNLTDQRKFPCKESHQAVFCYSNYGPCFGGQNAELVAWQPFNAQNNGGSVSLETVYEIGTDKEGRNMLTNQTTDYFTIVEIEVWQLSGDFIAPATTEKQLTKSDSCIIF